MSEPPFCCGDYPECYHLIEQRQRTVERNLAALHVNEPSPQHKAECDCAEFEGGKCEWCETCKSCHTEEFGREFHDRVLKPRIVSQWTCDAPWSSLNVGDIVTFENVRPRRRWWQFWHRFEKPSKLELQQFKVTSVYPGLSTEPIDIHKELYK